MCGIIGVLGAPQSDIVADILAGLKRLEYRGYDSAGIATINKENGLMRCRAEGKLHHLEDALAATPLSGALGVGHTRWATHGAATEQNAHPHNAGRVAVVHNGIIENFKALKDELEAAGCEFSSDTDTEVIAHLFASQLDATSDIYKAAQNTFARLEGAYAIGLIIDGYDDLMIMARQGSPLAVGHGEKESQQEGEQESAMYLGSDAFALAPFTRRITYLEDGDWGVIRRDKLEIFAASGQAVARPIQQVEAATSMVDKGNHRHFMAKEIYEQPDVLSRSFGQYIDASTRRVTLPQAALDLSHFKRVMLVACGTAYFAACIARDWIERYAKIPASVDIASEFRYRDTPMDKDCLMVFVSQSGETADTLAALRRCKQLALPTIGVVNVPESSLAREADVVLPSYAGPEIGVASTKAFTAQLATLVALAIALGRAQNTLSAADEHHFTDLLLQTPRLANDVLATEPQIAAIASNFGETSSALFMGRATMYPLALEGALKLKEISYIHAEGFAAGELKHGSIALVDQHVPIITIAPVDSLFDKTISNMQEVMARGGRVILLSSAEGIAKAGAGATASIALPEMDAFIAPILYALPLQLLAYHAALAKGTDVDQPRNLAKSVTVE